MECAVCKVELCDLLTPPYGEPWYMSQSGPVHHDCLHPSVGCDPLDIAAAEAEIIEITATEEWKLRHPA